jgi:hypothetical protein
MDLAEKVINCQDLLTRWLPPGFQRQTESCKEKDLRAVLNDSVWS